MPEPAPTAIPASIVRPRPSGLVQFAEPDFQARRKRMARLSHPIQCLQALQQRLCQGEDPPTLRPGALPW